MIAALKEHSLRDWAIAGRIPFTPASVAPFVVGCVIAYRAGHSIDLSMCILGTIAAFLIHIAGNLIGEATDNLEDSLTFKFGRTKFSGGALSVVTGKFTRQDIYIATAVSLALAAVIGVFILVRWNSPTLFALGAIGGLCALLYALPPVRLASLGLGELTIGFAFGWLTIVTGYACASGQFMAQSWLVTLPVSLTIFNVIFLNEFPDYEPDKAARKKNLVVRLGREKSSYLYALSSLCVAASLLALWFVYKPQQPLYLLAVLPGAVLSLTLGWKIAVGRKWTSIEQIEPLMGLGILLNLVASISTGFLLA